MVNSQIGNRKNKSSTNIYINKKKNELNELSNVRANVVCEKIGVSLKGTNKTSTGNADKNSTKTGKKMRKTLEHVGTKRKKKQHKKN